MKALYASVLLIGLVQSSANARPRHCMFRLHVEANAQDTDAFASSVKAQLSGKNVAIEKIPRISEQDVIGFKPYQHEGGGDFGVLLQLDDHGRIALDTLTVERRGRYAFVFINGRPITEIMIDKRISDGKLYIKSGLTAADLMLMKKDWKLIKPVPKPAAAEPVGR